MADVARTLVVWCPDWPLVAAGIEPSVPAAVVAGQDVLAASAAARAEGVRRGLRVREAQRRSPALLVVADDPARDVRAFEPVLAAVEAFTPKVEVVRPGVCAFATRGPSRYFGGDQALAAQVAEAVSQVTAQVSTGIADGPFAAGLAARRGLVVPPGGSPEFLAPLPIHTLDRPELTDLLVRLGLHTLGDFAALPPDNVLDRFGTEGARAHRLACGLDDRPLRTRQPPPELTVEIELDPPVERVDTAAFAARSLAEQFHERLARHGMACTRVSIEAQTEHGEQLARLWRHNGALTAAAVADRMRWQLDGWINGSTAEERPSSGITLLRLVPDQVAPDEGVQAMLWGGPVEIPDRAARSFARVQGMLGPAAVVTAVPGGGRSPLDQVTWVPWGDAREAVRSAVPPWPGRIPAPFPATVYPEALPAEVHDAAGLRVTVTGRHVVSAPPARLTVAGRSLDVVGWAGPWPADERWWDPATRRRRARFQVQASDGSAWLLAVENGRWWAEACYD